MPVRAPGGPCPDPVHHRVVRIGRRETRRRHHGQVHGRRAATDARCRGRPGAGVVADLDDVDAPVEDLRQRHRAGSQRSMRVVGRQRQLEQELRQRATRHALLRRRPEHDLAGPPADVAERGEMIGHAAGQDDRELGPPLGHGRDQRGHLAEGAPFVGGRRIPGPDQHAPDARLEQQGRHRQRVDGLCARRVDAPAAPGGRGREWGQGAFRGGDDRQAARRVAGDLEPGQVDGAAAAELEGSCQRRIGLDHAVAEDRDERLHVRAGRHRHGPDQAPARTDPPDQCSGDGRGPRVQGQEGAGLARHPCMLPGPAEGRFGRGPVRRPRRSPRPTPRAGR